MTFKLFQGFYHAGQAVARGGLVDFRHEGVGGRVDLQDRIVDFSQRRKHL